MQASSHEFIKEKKKPPEAAAGGGESQSHLAASSSIHHTTRPSVRWSVPKTMDGHVIIHLADIMKD
jgi:hypothetical protein